MHIFLEKYLVKLVKNPFVEFLEKVLEDFSWKFLKKSLNKDSGGFSESSSGAIFGCIAEENTVEIPEEMPG